MHFFRSDSRVSALQSSTAATGAFAAAGCACLDNVGQVTLIGRGVRSRSADSPHAPVSRSARHSQVSRRPCQCFARVILTAPDERRPRRSLRSRLLAGRPGTLVAGPRARRARLAGGSTVARSTHWRSFPVVRVTVECLASGAYLVPIRATPLLQHAVLFVAFTKLREEQEQPFCGWPQMHRRPTGPGWSCTGG